MGLLRRLVNTAAVGLAALAAHAADIPGAKDPPYLKRYEGSEIVSFQSLTYESYNVALPDPAKPT